MLLLGEAKQPPAMMLTTTLPGEEGLIEVVWNKTVAVMLLVVNCYDRRA